MANDPMTLDALSKSLMAGLSSRGQMDELDIQRQQANALRDTPQAQGGRRSGYVSPFMIAANTAQRLSGEREGRRLGKERQGLSQAVAQAQTDEKMYGLGVQQDVRDQTQDNWQTGQDTGVEQFGLKQAAGERRAAEAMGRHGDTLAARAVEQDASQAWREHQSEIQESQFASKQEFAEAQAALAQGNANRLYELKIQKATEIDPEKLKGMTGEHKKALVGNQEAINDINDINSVVSEFTPEETAIMQDAKKQLSSLIVDAIAPAEFQQWARKNISKYPPKIQKYFELVNQFSGKIRHDVYGSALTGTEVNFSNMWLPGNTGLSLEQHQSRLENLANRARGSQEAIGKAYEHDFMNILPEYKGVEAPLPATDDKGGELMTDKNGKRAYVYPDGTFKEVQ